MPLDLISNQHIHLCHYLYLPHAKSNMMDLFLFQLPKMLDQVQAYVFLLFMVGANVMGSKIFIIFTSVELQVQIAHFLLVQIKFPTQNGHSLSTFTLNIRKYFL